MARIVWDDMETPGGIAGMPAHRVAIRKTRAIESHPWTLLRDIRATLALWGARRRQRNLLAQLDARMLHDIGLTRDDARRECAKPFWR